jgi:uncharacterized membrane protein YbhN (UPF0104 family)
MNFLRTLLKVAFVLGAILFTLIYVVNQWQEIAVYLDRIRWIDIGVASVLFVIGMTLLPLGVVLGFQFMHYEVAIPAIYRAYALSQIAKYLPGSVWALPGRIFLYNRIGIPASVGINNLMAELILMIAGAAIVAILALYQHMMELQLLMALILIGVITCVLIIKLFHSKPSLLLRLPLSQRLKGFLAKIKWYFSYKQSIILVILYTVIWGIFGVAFDYVLAAVSVSSIESLYAAGLFASGWTLGFIVLLTPGGIGIREAVLIAGISIFVNAPLPVVIAALSRILWTIAELFSLGFAYFINYAAERLRKRSEALHREIL